LGLEEEALAFYTAMTQSSFTFESFTSNNRVSARSKSYWSRAIHRQLNIAPEVENADQDELRIGPKFLREYELKRKRFSKEPDDSPTSQKESQSHEIQKAIVVPKEPSESQTTQKEDESHEGQKESVQGGTDGADEEIVLNKGNEALERMIAAPNTIMDESMYEGQLFDSSSDEKDPKAE
jgi:hypothetical protein